MDELRRTGQSPDEGFQQPKVEHYELVEHRLIVQIQDRSSEHVLVFQVGKKKHTSGRALWAVGRSTIEERFKVVLGVRPTRTADNTPDAAIESQRRALRSTGPYMRSHSS